MVASENYNMQSVVIAKPQAEAIHITKNLKLFSEITSEKHTSLQIDIYRFLWKQLRKKRQLNQRY